jgi:peroxiredoxin (alkyl hydroperoxide reductase subunit C)
VNNSKLKGGVAMSDCCESHLKLGHLVPDFELDTYEPSLKDFGKISLAEQKKAGKWTVLFFYPADFTFV